MGGLGCPRRGSDSAGTQQLAADQRCGALCGLCSSGPHLERRRSCLRWRHSGSRPGTETALVRHIVAASTRSQCARCGPPSCRPAGCALGFPPPPLPQTRRWGARSESPLLLLLWLHSRPSSSSHQPPCTFPHHRLLPSSRRGSSPRGPVPLPLPLPSTTSTAHLSLTSASTASGRARCRTTGPSTAGKVRVLFLSGRALLDAL